MLVKDNAVARFETISRKTGIDPKRLELELRSLIDGGLVTTFVVEGNITLYRATPEGIEYTGIHPRLASYITALEKFASLGYKVMHAMTPGLCVQQIEIPQELVDQFFEQGYNLPTAKRELYVTKRGVS